MFIPFDTIDTDQKIESDICIVGAGAAGITLAMEFAKTDLNVCLLESGTLDVEERNQELYEATETYEGVPDERILPMESVRLRYFGGTTNHFSGGSGELGAIDFRHRPWVPNSGWPIGEKDLAPAYDRARSYMDLGKYANAKKIWNNFDLQPYDFDLKKIGYHAERWTGYINGGVGNWEGPVRFGQKYRKELKNSKNIRVFFSANAYDIKTNAEANYVTEVEVRSFSGKRTYISARAFVLATGGLEVARLLLSSDTVESGGLGNQQDLVGRNYIDHHVAIIGSVTVGDPNRFANLFSRTRVFNKMRSHVSLRAADSWQEKHQVLNNLIGLIGDDDESAPIYAAREVYLKLKRGEISKIRGEKLLSALSGVSEVAYQWYRAREGHEVWIPKIDTFDVRLITEQAPNDESRVFLNDEKDELGMRRLTVSVSMTELDKRSMLKSGMLVASECARLGIGRTRLEEWLTSDSGDFYGDRSGGSHHCGTTRMSNSPQNGVVNSDCRMHSVDNLYVASSAVFPTNGYVSPTYTIVALTIRLADHLKSILK